MFTRFIDSAEKQSGARVKRVRTDNGTEICNKEFKELFTTRGIKHELTNVYTPEQNGACERFNRTLLNMVRAMLAEAGLPDEWLAETAMCACYVSNHMTYKVLGTTTPHELWHGSAPSVSHFKTFGCLTFVHVPKQLRTKLEKRVKIGILLGYATKTRGFRIWLVEVNKVVEMANVSFDESRRGIDYFRKL